MRKRLLELKQTLPELTYDLALVLEQQGRFEEAVRMYCETLKEQPKFPEALLNLVTFSTGWAKAWKPPSAGNARRG